VLDLGCGTGWASRRLARIVTSGEVVGLDVADEMLRRAEQTSAGISNVRYVWGSRRRFPAADNAFSKILSVESFITMPTREKRWTNFSASRLRAANCLS